MYQHKLEQDIGAIVTKRLFYRAPEVSDSEGWN